MNGDTFSRRDYVYIYTGNVLAATVKGRYKRHWAGEKGGLSGAAFFDLYTDPRELNGKLVPMLSAKGMFDLMRARHDLWMEKYPNTPEARNFPFTGLENPRPETLAASRPRVDPAKLPFDAAEAVKRVPGWDGIELDQAE